MSNIILNTDSYKYSQYNQYPSGTEYVYSYIESRGGPWTATLFYGMQAFLKEYLAKPITMEDIDEAEAIVTAHGEPFYREGWEYILNEYGGFLPVLIRSVDEGTIVPVGNVLVDIINTDPKCWWLTSFLETALLRAIWYPTTVATNSLESKKIIQHHLEINGDPTLIDFKLHDFGGRGVSSFESAGLGGSAHLINFKGTDTISSLSFIRKYYAGDIAGFSIPAMEHSTVTSWGKEHEVDSFRNMLKLYGKPGAILACVSDSYDIYKACEMWGTQLKDEVIASGATVVIRPDSGEPSQVVLDCLRILDKHFGHTVNAKGYKVLNNVRVIQGDGIDHTTINSILSVMHLARYSADNVAFGQGGALLQQVNRDTMKFAMKCSAAYINGEWRDVFKDPIGDQTKRSKKGILCLIKENGKYKTVVEKDFGHTEDDLLILRYVDGEILNKTTFEEIRARSRS